MLLPTVSSGVVWVVHTGSIVITNAVDMNNRANRNRLDVNFPNDFGKEPEAKVSWAE
jgi:hypothetical protein